MYFQREKFSVDIQEINAVHHLVNMHIGKYLIPDEPWGRIFFKNP